MSNRLLSPLVRWAEAAHYGAPAGVTVLTGLVQRDMVFGGFGQIVDTVDIEGVPAPRRVWLLDRKTALVVRDTWSDPVTGQYRFDYLTLEREFIVYALDHENLYNAVIADRITAEPMP